MKASLTSTDRLNIESRPGSCLAAMKASMSGWSQDSVAIMAPRREPADMMVRHMASHTSMKLSGPDASAPMPWTTAPLGLRVEESEPMPPDRKSGGEGKSVSGRGELGGRRIIKKNKTSRRTHSQTSVHAE